MTVLMEARGNKLVEAFSPSIRWPGSGEPTSRREDAEFISAGEFERGLFSKKIKSSPRLPIRVFFRSKFGSLSLPTVANPNSSNPAISGEMLVKACSKATHAFEPLTRQRLYLITSPERKAGGPDSLASSAKILKRPWR